MQTIDRRKLFLGVSLTVAATAAGAVLGARALEAMPLSGHAIESPAAPIAKAQVVVVAPRRRRRWTCWWRRGRRICGWRWF
jgi:hypothetical protein